MACRIGMTANEKERRQHWEKEHPSLRNWQILGHYSTKSEAQKAEIMFAQHYGCDSHGGGGGTEYDNWVVYKFDY